MDKDKIQEAVDKIKATVAELNIRVETFNGAMHHRSTDAHWNSGAESKADMIIGLYREKPLIDTQEMRLVIRKERGDNEPGRTTPVSFDGNFRRYTER